LRPSFLSLLEKIPNAPAKQDRADYKGCQGKYDFYQTVYHIHPPVDQRLLEEYINTEGISTTH
jgi:hypothetical protein